MEANEVVDRWTENGRLSGKEKEEKTNIGPKEVKRLMKKKRQTAVEKLIEGEKKGQAAKWVEKGGSEKMRQSMLRGSRAKMKGWMRKMLEVVDYNFRRRPCPQPKQKEGGKDRGDQLENQHRKEGKEKENDNVNKESRAG